jgi:hypothetical protein
LTDGAYNLPCLEEICKLVKQMHAWGDERIKKIVAALAAEGMKISSGLQMPAIPYISNDNFSQEGIFDYWNGHLPGHAHVKRTYLDVVRMWRQFHGCPGSGGGIERVFTAAGKQHDDLKKRTMDKTLESTLKAGMNTKLPTCDDKGAFTDDEGTHRKRK